LLSIVFASFPLAITAVKEKVRGIKSVLLCTRYKTQQLCILKMLRYNCGRTFITAVESFSFKNTPNQGKTISKEYHAFRAAVKLATPAPPRSSKKTFHLPNSENEE
jgi:hypothetical protein